MSMTVAGETTESRAVSPLELFYDLVFVFAILSCRSTCSTTFPGVAPPRPWCCCAQCSRWGSTPASRPPSSTCPGARPSSHTENVPFDSAHMAERLRLFLLIAVGEAVLTTGTAISESPSDPLTLVAGPPPFAAIACLWALYFGGSEYIVEHHIT